MNALTASLTRAFHGLIEGILRNIGGGIGMRLRAFYYSFRLASCGRNLRIDVGVIIENPGNITFGDDVCILPYTIITARGGPHDDSSRKVIRKTNASFCGNPGSIRIGSQVAIGAYNIIHGYGGLEIGNRCTTSARVSIYSYSHYPSDPEHPSTITYANAMVDGPVVCVESPIVLCDGVWLGLGATIFGGCVGRNSFVTAGSLVINDLPSNSYAAGSPAMRIKARFAVVPEDESST
jgi:acetyltransferase-like isoleucine patch superfamily enzyme